MFYIAMDIGATYVRTVSSCGGEFDFEGIEKYAYVECRDFMTAVDRNLCEKIDRMISAHGNPDAISLAFPGNTDEFGNVTVWPNRPEWNGFGLKRYLTEKYGCPVSICDDANCAAWGEYLWQSPKNGNMVCLSIGSGLGCGIILNGRLYLGDHGHAGEAGHMYIGTKARCSCGNVGCAQSVSSGRALIRATGHSFSDVMEHPAYGGAYRAFIDGISRVIYNIVMLLDISDVVIAGGIGSLDLAEELTIATEKLLVPFSRKIAIRRATLGENAGIYGAMLLIEQS